MSCVMSDRGCCYISVPDTAQHRLLFPGQRSPELVVGVGAHALSRREASSRRPSGHSARQPAWRPGERARARGGAGAGVAAATDLTFSAYGYAAVVLNDFLTALYLILVKNSPASSGLTTTGLLFYNAALSLPLLGGAVALSGEPAGILAYPDKHSRGFQARRAGRACSRVWRWAGLP